MKIKKLAVTSVLMLGLCSFANAGSLGLGVYFGSLFPFAFTGAGCNHKHNAPRVRARAKARAPKAFARNMKIGARVSPKNKIHAVKAGPRRQQLGQTRRQQHGQTQRSFTAARK
jgi:hypothetical protein